MAKKQIAKSEEQRRLLENLAAISAEFHSNRDQYDDYYARYADALSGFPGIWNQMIVMARAFTSVESNLASAVDHEWIDAIVDFASLCYDIKPGKGEYQRYKRAAKDAINEASY